MLAWPLDEVEQRGELRVYSTDTLYALEQTITVVFISLPMTGTVSDFVPTGTITNIVTITDINDWIICQDPPYGALPQSPYVAFYKTDMVILAETQSAGGGDDIADGKGNGDRKGKGDGDENMADHFPGSISGKIAMVVGGWVVAMVIGGA